jgi:RNA polymerase sigma factor (sigma-70 family)
MMQGKTGGVNRQLELLFTTGTMTGLSDAQLLNRFAQTRDSLSELAFGELINRHGPMVFSVCRQILRDSHDADDAFQATFLVLVRRAHAIRVGESLAPWLYSVAYRTARRAGAAASRYRLGKVELIHDLETSPEDAYKLDLRPMLYEELGRLPGKYRAPIVLCHLEGKTHEEAARLLSWPVGTLSGRLSRGRQLLRSRLERRGVTAPSVIFSAPWLVGSRSVVTTRLVERTLTAATRFAAAQSISTSVLSLTQGVLRTMLLRKLGTISFAILILGSISGAGVWAHRPSAPTSQPSREAEPASVSTQNSGATPAANPNAAPRSKPQTPAGSQSIAADSRLADCPLTGCDDAPPYCPITLATNALTRMIGHFHVQSVSVPSK